MGCFLIKLCQTICKNTRKINGYHGNKNKRYLVHFTFSEGLKSTSNSLQNFKSLTLKVLVITGGSLNPIPFSIKVISH